jgi:hypothetical protein
MATNGIKIVKDELILFLKGNIRGVFEDIPEFC